MAQTRYKVGKKGVTPPTVPMGRQHKHKQTPAQHKQSLIHVAQLVVSTFFYLSLPTYLKNTLEVVHIVVLERSHRAPRQVDARLHVLLHALNEKLKKINKRGDTTKQR